MHWKTVCLLSSTLLVCSGACSIHLLLTWILNRDGLEFSGHCQRHSLVRQLGSALSSRRSMLWNHARPRFSPERETVRNRQESHCFLPKRWAITLDLQVPTVAEEAQVRTVSISQNLTRSMRTGFLHAAQWHISRMVGLPNLLQMPCASVRSRLEG